MGMRKKLISLLTAVTMLSSYSLPAFAEEIERLELVSSDSITLGASYDYLQGDWFEWDGVNGVLTLFGQLPDTKYDDTTWKTHNLAYFANINSELIKKIVVMPNTKTGTNADRMFAEMSNLTEIEGLPNLDTSDMNRMGYMFGECSSLRSLDLSGFDTSNVTSLNGTFCDCSSLTSIDLTNFDTSNVSNMSFTFCECESLTSIKMAGIDISFVYDMNSMFRGCTSLTSLDMSWFNISSVGDTAYMFMFCDSLKTLDLSGFDTSSASLMSGMFDGCSSLETIIVSDKWNIEDVSYTDRMFSDCNALIGGNGTVYDSTKTDKEYARIDTADAPGYLTASNEETDFVTVEPDKSYQKDGNTIIQTLIYSDPDSPIAYTITSSPNALSFEFDESINGEMIDPDDYVCYAIEIDPSIKTYSTNGHSYNMSDCWRIVNNEVNAEIPFAESSYINAPQYFDGSKVSVPVSGSFTDGGMYIGNYDLANNGYPGFSYGEMYGFSDLAVKVWYTKKHTHSYGEPEWTWSNDYSAATAKFSCTECTDVQTVTAAITSVTTQPTCTANGKKTYTAKAVFNGTEYTDSKYETINALGHTPANAVKENEKAATYSAVGSYDEVVYCSRCREELERKTVTVPMLVLAKPAVTATAGSKQVTLTWNAVTGAAQYRVYRYDNGRYTALVNTTGMSYTVSELTNFTKYSFLVRAINGSNGSAYSSADVVYATPIGTLAKPNFTATAGNKSVAVKWNAVADAKSYRVYKVENGKIAYLGETASTTYTAADLTNGTKYGFLVRAFNGNYGSAYANSDIKYATPFSTLAKPNFTVTAGNKSVTVKWSAVSGATSYRVYKVENGKIAYLNEVTGTSYTASNLTNGTKYGFLVRAFNGNTGSAYNNSDIKYATPAVAASIAKPTFTATAATGSVTVKWSAVSGATSYRVYQKNGTKITFLKEVTALTYTDTTVANGTKYGYLVRAFKGSTGSSYTDSDWEYVTPLAKPNVTVTAGTKSATVKWNKVTGAASYRVYRVDGTKITALANTTATTYTASVLTTGTKYGFIVRAFNGNDGSTYSNADIVYVTAK